MEFDRFCSGNSINLSVSIHTVTTRSFLYFKSIIFTYLFFSISVNYHLYFNKVSIT